MCCVPELFDISDNDSIQRALIPLSHLFPTYSRTGKYREWDAHGTKSLGCWETIHIINTFWRFECKILSLSFTVNTNQLDINTIRYLMCVPISVRNFKKNSFSCLTVVSLCKLWQPSVTHTLVTSTKNIQPYPAADNPDKQQRQDPPSDVPFQVYAAWKVQRCIFAVCSHFLCTAIIFLEVNIWYLLCVSSQVKECPWNGFEDHCGGVKIKLKENNSLHVNRSVPNECMPAHKSGWCRLPFSDYNEYPGWIGSSMAKAVSVRVNIHQLFVHSLCGFLYYRHWWTRCIQLRFQ